MIDEKVIKENYERFMSIIGEDDRSEHLIKMYEDFGNQLVEAPASCYTHWHNAYLGGYLDHVLHVHDLAIKLAKVYMDSGGRVEFTPQELKFAALHHDLGKLGEPGEPYYIEEDSEWHRNKLNRKFKHNNIQYMGVTDRALYLLQQYDVKVTQNEYVAIKLSDGMYDEGNKSYLKNSMYPYPLKDNLYMIIHQADYMATNIERERTRF